MLVLLIGFIIIAITFSATLVFWKYHLHMSKISILLFKIDIDENKIIIQTLLDKSSNDHLKALSLMFDKKINNDGIISISLIKFLENNTTNSKSIINSLLITLKKFHQNSPKIDWRKTFDIILRDDNSKQRGEENNLKFKMSLMNYQPTKRTLYGKLSCNFIFLKKGFFKEYKNKVLDYNIDNKIMKISLLKKYHTGVVVYINLNDYLSGMIGKKTGIIGIIKNILFENLIKNGFIVTSEKHLEFYVFKFSKLKTINSKKTIERFLKKIYKEISKELYVNLHLMAGISFIHDLKNVNTVNSLRQKAKFAYNLLQERLNKKENNLTNRFHYLVFNVSENEERYKKFMNSYLIFKTAMLKLNFVFNSNPVIDYEKNSLIGNLIDILPVENISIFQNNNIRRQTKICGLEEEYDILSFKLLKKEIKNFKNKENYIIRISSMTFLNSINSFIDLQDHSLNSRIIILINDFEKLSVNKMMNITTRLRHCNYKVALYNVDNYLNSEKYLRVLMPDLIFLSRKLIKNIHNNIENQIKMLTIQNSLSNNRNCLIVDKAKTLEDSLFLSDHGFKNLVS